MLAPFRTRRTAGLLAVAAVGLSTAALGSAGVAAATPSALTFSTADGDTTVLVPTGTCAIDWTIYGGRGGADDRGDKAASPIGSQVRTLVSAGDTFDLHPGGRGGDAGTDPAGGVNAFDSAWNGQAGSTTQGGGGAASVVIESGSVYLSDGGSMGVGGAYNGGEVPDPWTAQRLQDPTTNPMAPPMPADQSDGLISGTGVVCGTEATTPPDAPVIVMGEAGSRQLLLHISLPTDPGATMPQMPPPGPEVAAPSGWEYSLDEGPWTIAASAGVPTPGTARTFAVTGLTDGHNYKVRVRATSTAGPSAASTERTFSPWTKPGAPGNLQVQTGPSTLTVSWSASSPGTYPLAHYEVDVFTEGDDGSADGVGCFTDASAHSCTIDVPAGAAYDLELYARDQYMYVSDVVRATSGVVPGTSSTPSTPGTPSTPSTSSTPSAPSTPSTPSLTTPPAVPATPPAASGKVTGESGSVVSTITPGATTTLTGSGYAPNSTVDLYVYSTPQKIGTTVTDASGSFTATVTLPTNLAAGTHHLVASGVDANGNARFLRTDVTLAAAASSSQLAWTGFDAVPFAATGALAVVLGAGLLVVVRRRRTV